MVKKGLSLEQLAVVSFFYLFVCLLKRESASNKPHSSGPHSA